MDSILEISFNDYKEFLQYEGDIIGCVKSISKENFVNNIIDRYNNYLLKARAIIIEFEINEKTSLFEINDFIAYFHDTCYSNCNLVFGVKENKNIQKEQILFKMLISGVEVI